MANPVKKQLKAARKAEKNFDKQQEARNIQTRIAAQKSGSPIPLGAQKKPGFFGSTNPQAVSINTLTPQQQQLVDQLSGLIPQGIQNLNLPGNESSFQPIANEARRNFSQNTIPTLAERFAGLGRNSSGLQQTLGGAEAQFESQLAAAQAQHGLQEQGLQSSNLFNLLQAGLSPQFDYYAQPGQKSFARETFDTLLPIGAQAGLGYLTGGGLGAAAGAANGATNNQTNGSGIGKNSFGFQGVKQPNWAKFGNGAQNMGYQDILSSIKPY